MPKDEFDFADPLELRGVALRSAEDTTAEMAACFAEEFVRLGYDHWRVLALFRDPRYTGAHLAWCQQGEPFVRDVIGEVFARRGRAITWATAPQR